MVNNSNFSIENVGLSKKKSIISCFILILFLWVPLSGNSQNRLSEYIESARNNNPEIIRLQQQIKILELGKQSIRAMIQAPKGYLTSEIAITPYLNNKGQLFSTNPVPTAVGYDVGITNGGLYSALMNVDVPLFVKKTTQNALHWQDQQINALKIKLRNQHYRLQYKLTDLYYSAFGAQLAYLTQKESLDLMSRELKILEQLTRKGLYRVIDYQLFKTSISSDSIKLQNLAITFRLQLMQLKSFCGIKNTDLDTLRMDKLVLSTPNLSVSSFLLPYSNDSLTALAQDRLFNNRYQPKVLFYSNAGLNAIALPGIQRKLGLGAGIRFSYTLFDGKQKQLNKAQSLILIDQSTRLKQVKTKNISLQRAGLLKAIGEANNNLQNQKKLKKDYKNLISLYKLEIQKGQVTITGFLIALRNYNNIKLSYGLASINLNKLVNQYNYWNH